MTKAQDIYPTAEFNVHIAPDVTVQANNLLALIFENLLDNAVYHNDAETPRVTVTVEEQSQFIRTRIADNGPGMPQEKDRFFEPGESGDRGLGLYLVNRLVEQYGGHLTFQENEPQGTVAIVDLPQTTS